jgi:hypothetical protein
VALCRLSSLERLWIDHVTELAREADADPSREAAIVAIGIHPLVVGRSSDQVVEGLLAYLV